MLLTIDIGNTNITLGLYEGEARGPSFRVATIHREMPDEYGMKFLNLLEHAGISLDQIEGICMASVVPPLTSKVIQACEKFLGHSPLNVDAGCKTGVRILYEDPKAVGADRIVDCAAVQRLYG